ncbi:hypothetical protein Ddye_022613 [Dipteronia dyeriana]|uniref:Uncharacterized protein n=1 Tax=Dipteronia dyeriana TaxID=168575 RepID=A0AAD9TRE8_9ROSI|nr:hypothetical protein Ddye_022613 [Dipteronia dyeriana]
MKQFRNSIKKKTFHQNRSLFSQQATSRTRLTSRNGSNQETRKAPQHLHLRDGPEVPKEPEVRDYARKHNN